MEGERPPEHPARRLGVSTLTRQAIALRAETSGGTALMTRTEAPLVSLSEYSPSVKVVRHPSGTPPTPTVYSWYVWPRPQQTGMLDERRSVAHALPPRMSLREPCTHNDMHERNR